MSLGLKNKEKRDKGGHSHSSSLELPVQERLLHILPVELCLSWIYLPGSSPVPLRVQTPSTRELTAPLLKNPRPTSPRWNFPDYNHFQRQPQDLSLECLRDASPRHCRGFASTCSWERRQISFHEYFEFKYNLTKHCRGQATLLALPSTLSEAPKPAQPMPAASDDCSSLLSEARKLLFFLRRA